MTEMDWLGRLKQSLHRRPPELDRVLLAVVIGADRVVAVSWSVAGETLDIFGQGTASFSEVDDLPETVKAVADLALGGSEPAKFFIGVPPEWVSQGQMAPEKTQVIQLIAAALGTPLGGIVPSLEALVAYLKNLEMPATAVLVEIGHSRLRTSIARASQVLGTRVVSKQEDSPKVICQSLEATGIQPPYPSHLVIYGENDLADQKEILMQYSWPEGYFVHLPRVSILEEEVLAEAIAFASAINLKRMVAEQRETTDRPSPPAAEKIPVQKETWADRSEGGEVGFRPGKEKALPQSPEMAQFRSFRFGRPKQIFRQATSVFLHFKLPRPGKSYVLLVGLSLGIIVVGAVLYLSLLKAKVTLMIEAQTLSVEVPLVVSTKKMAETGEKVISAIEEEAVVEGEKKIATTGTKLIGDPAKGEVVVYNKTLIAKTFPGETVLAGTNNLRFTLNSPVTVPAAIVATSSGSETKTYGKEKVEVTATDFGKAGNLPGGTQLSFQDYSNDQYLAENESAFTGGSSQEIKVVAQKDRDSLAHDLEADLKKRARESLLERLGNDREVIEEGVELKISDKEFSAEVGQEADEINLKAKAKATAYLYQQAELEDLVKAIVGEKTPDGYRALANQTEINLAYQEPQPNGFLASLKIKAVILPDLDLGALKKQILGRSPEQAKAQLINLPRVRDARIEIWPRWLPGVLLRVPRFADKIEIRLAAA